MALLLEDLPQLILLATDYSCSLDQQTNWAAVECLHTFLETLQEMVSHPSRFSLCMLFLVFAAWRTAASRSHLCRA